MWSVSCIGHSYLRPYGLSGGVLGIWRARTVLPVFETMWGQRMSGNPVALSLLARGDGGVSGRGDPRRRAGHVLPMQVAAETSLAGMGPTVETGDSAGGRTPGSGTVGHPTGAVDAGGGRNRDRT